MDESIIFLFLLYLLENVERSSVPGLSSHMNSWKSKKNDDFVYAEEGNVGEHDLTKCSLLGDNYLITLDKKSGGNYSSLFAWFLRSYIHKRSSVYQVTRLTSFRDNLCQMYGQKI